MTSSTWGKKKTYFPSCLITWWNLVCNEEKAIFSPLFPRSGKSEFNPFSHLPPRCNKSFYTDVHDAHNILKSMSYFVPLHSQKSVYSG